ncbi:MAG: tetratricopeptide (TPR) repeat protein [Myxococcota bacterium]|jgi:tetratricopeptide (TPR) repeat protein
MLLVFAVLVTAMLQGQLANAACTPATEARQDGRFEDAEDAARHCLEDTPRDLATWFELSRAIGYQTRFSEALHWIEQALVKAPQDIDMRLWRVRVLGWMGRPDDAIDVLDAMVASRPSLLEDPETATLSSNLRLWSKAQWTARVEISPRVALSGGGVAEWDTHLSAWFRASEALHLGVRGEIHERRGEETPVRDVIGYVSAAWHGHGWGIGAEAGLGVNAVAVPTTSVWVEPEIRIVGGLSTSLRYWRVDYKETGAHVVTPGLRAELGDWSLDLRYYLGFPDADDTTHSGLARLGWAWSEAWRVEIGAAAGGGSDYLETISRDTDGHVLGLVGLRWRPVERWSIRLGYTWRRDDNGEALLDRHEVQAGIAVTL